GRRGFNDAGDSRRTKIDDLHRPGFIDHDVVWSDVLMQHLHSVKGAQALGDLLYDPTHAFQIWFWVIDHPLRQGLAVDEFHRHIQVAAFSGLQARLQHMRAIDAPSRPFFHQESLEVSRIVAQVDRWNFYDDQGVIFGVDGQIDMASAAAVYLSNNSISVENHSRV